MSLMKKEKKAWKKMKKIEKENIKEIKSIINKGLHRCSYHDLDIEWRDYSSLFGGAVLQCNEDNFGKLYVNNDEYGNRVNYCPFCGYKSKMQMKLKK